MPARPLALAALLLLAPAPAAAQTVTEASSPPATSAPAEVPSGPDGTSIGGPDDPAPSAAPVAEPPAPDSPDDDAPSPRAQKPDPGPVPHTVPPTPDTSGAEVPGERAEQPVDATAVTGARRPSPAGEPTAAAGATVGPSSGRGEASSEDARAQPGQPPESDAQPEREQVTPGTVHRITLGALTRVPAQGPPEEPGSGPPPAAWGLGLSAVGAVAAGALLVRRLRTGRARN